MGIDPRPAETIRPPLIRLIRVRRKTVRTASVGKAIMIVVLAGVVTGPAAR